MATLNEQQLLFLHYLFDADSETRGDTLQSCLAAGYDITYHQKLVRILKDEIRERTHDQIAGLGVKAVMGMENALYEDGSIPKGDIRLKAAESILDRMGVSKQQAIDITSKDESISPLFILPAKGDVNVDPEYDQYQEEDAED